MQSKKKHIAFPCTHLIKKHKEKALETIFTNGKNIFKKEALKPFSSGITKMNLSENVSW